MIKVYERLSHCHEPITDSITLDQDTRKKARIKSTTNEGFEIGIFVERGHPLLVGEILKSECGKHIEVKGQAEPVSTAKSNDWLSFSKVCYHLGNRHTSMQIGKLWLRFKPDHVLEELAENYGLTVDKTPAIFEPESGAYGSKSLAYKHDSSHDHSHEH
ncbi:MAG: urease accessory protein UreE [Colwellia sp.]|nr:urease accessory protein UreE [Colwellia sp.]